MCTNIYTYFPLCFVLVLYRLVAMSPPLVSGDQTWFLCSPSCKAMWCIPRNHLESSPRSIRVTQHHILKGLHPTRVFEGTEIRAILSCVWKTHNTRPCRKIWKYYKKFGILDFVILVCVSFWWSQIYKLGFGGCFFPVEILIEKILNNWFFQLLAGSWFWWLLFSC